MEDDDPAPFWEGRYQAERRTPSLVVKLTSRYARPLAAGVTLSSAVAGTLLAQMAPVNGMNTNSRTRKATGTATIPWSPANGAGYQEVEPRDERHDPGDGCDVEIRFGHVHQTDPEPRRGAENAYPKG